MFDLPDAKRVLRSELYTRSASSSPEPSSPIDPDVAARFQEQLASLYGVVPTVSYVDDTTADKGNDTTELDPRAHSNGHGDEDEEEQEFDFRLFSTATDTKIILKEEEIGDGGFTIRNRNRSYYFTGIIGDERRAQFASAAISGEDVLRGKDTRYWGLEVPWRVKVLRVGHGGQKTVGNHGLRDAANGNPEEKKKKPGKKRRIILRERMKKKQAREEAKRREKESKEEAEREKRTRRNREKKVKRKAKGKAMKGSNGVMDDANPGVGGDVD
ncbi:dolichyl pyrophosphate phosphatase protein [Rutstroemia sp. NJR-2017a WRK4]|nr:dolichyl pyrophosphate phosphatase protein [Rutstroemia sp. NJR-2017a WRK4]